MGGWWACFGSVFGSLVCQWVGWFVGSDCRSAGRSVRCLIVWIVGCSMVNWLVFLLISWLVNGLVCWLFGRWFS